MPFFSQFNTNYGLLGILDWVHGTDAKYVAHKKRMKEESERLAKTVANANAPSTS